MYALVTLSDIRAIGYRCEAQSHEDGQCQDMAVFQTYWPGRDGLKQCSRHAAWSAKVAETMGFRLEARALPVKVNDAEPEDGSAKRFEMMELS